MSLQLLPTLSHCSRHTIVNFTHLKFYFSNLFDKSFSSKGVKKKGMWCLLTSLANILTLWFSKEFICAGSLLDPSTEEPRQFYKSVSSNKVNRVEWINFIVQLLPLTSEEIYEEHEMWLGFGPRCLEGERYTFSPFLGTFRNDYGILKQCLFSWDLAMMRTAERRTDDLLIRICPARLV